MTAKILDMLKKSKVALHVQYDRSGVERVGKTDA